MLLATSATLRPELLKAPAQVTRPLLAYIGPSTAISCAAEEPTQVSGIFKTSAQRIWQAVHAQNRPEAPAP